MLLEAYPEPLVSPLEEDCLYYYENFDKACDLIKILSSPKKNVFLYICLFLQDVLKQNATNKIDVWKLGEYLIHELFCTCYLFCYDLQLHCSEGYYLKGMVLQRIIQFYRKRNAMTDAPSSCTSF